MAAAKPINSGTASTTGNAPPAVKVVRWATSTRISGLVVRSSLPLTMLPNGADDDVRGKESGIDGLDLPAELPAFARLE